MDLKEIIKHNKVMNRLARQATKDPKVKEMLFDLRFHFKSKVSGGWPLSYVTYLEMSGLSDVVFNKLLEQKKYKVYYDSRRSRVLIIKATK